MLQGMRAHTIIYDDIGNMTVQSQSLVYTTEFKEQVKALGFTPPRGKGFDTFMTYALKRGRSDHPHNAKWKPIYNLYTAMQVAQKLGS